MTGFAFGVGEETVAKVRDLLPFVYEACGDVLSSVGCGDVW